METGPVENVVVTPAPAEIPSAPPVTTTVGPNAAAEGDQFFNNLPGIEGGNNVVVCPPGTSGADCLKLQINSVLPDFNVDFDTIWTSFGSNPNGFLNDFESAFNAGAN